MNKDKALEIALEALELHGKQYPHMVKGYCLDAITAIKKSLETKEEYHWSKLIAGLRVDDDSVVIKLKGGNDEARYLCNKLIHQMEMNK